MRKVTNSKKIHQNIVIAAILGFLLVLSTSIANAQSGTPNDDSPTPESNPLMIEGEQIIKDYLSLRGEASIMSSSKNSKQLDAFLLAILNDAHPQLYTKDKNRAVTYYAVTKLGLPADTQTKTVNLKQKSLPDFGVSQYAYSRSAAVKYANNWVTKSGFKRNGSYPDFHNNGGDCTNFISQAMKAGGMSMAGSGTCRHENSSSEWYIQSLSSPCGWPGQTFRTWAWSTSWSAVANFRYFMRDHRSAFVEAYPANKEAVSLLISRVQAGDVVQFDVRSCNIFGQCSWTPTHTTLIVEKKNNGGYYLNDALYDAHTSEGSNLTDAYKESLRGRYNTWVNSNVIANRRMVWVRP